MADERTQLLDGIERDLAGVEQALARLESGTYLVCETCGGPLDAGLLVAEPTRTRCGGCVTAPAVVTVVEVAPVAGDDLPAA